MPESHNQAVREILGLDAGESFCSVSIKVASPDTIRSWSRGEVKNGRAVIALMAWTRPVALCYSDA